MDLQRHRIGAVGGRRDRPSTWALVPEAEQQPSLSRCNSLGFPCYKTQGKICGVLCNVYIWRIYMCSTREF